MNFRALAVAVAVFSLLLVSPASGQTPYHVTTLPPVPGGASSNASLYTEVGDAIYFFADPESDTAAIWKWTEAGGVVRVKSVFRDPYSSAPPVHLMALGDKLVFSAQVDSRGVELWITDGTSAGTTLIADLYEGGSSSPVPALVSGTKMYFTAYHPDFGRELWVTDGTTAGTSLVKDITVGSASSVPASFAESAGLVYFYAADQFFVTNGTEAGTISLASGVSGGGIGVHSGNVFFLGSDATNGRELWATNGTVAGTAMVKDINPGAASSWGGISTPFVNVAGGLLFFGEDATNGRELWFTDGTQAGTHLVEDITPGAVSTPLDLIVASGAGAFFVVDGSALWFSDGTDAVSLGDQGRVLAMAGGTNGAYLVVAGPKLVFSDGTPGGTIEITNVIPASYSRLTVTTRGVIFTGNDGSSGNEPCVTDGTEAGTELLVDLDTSTLGGSSITMLRPAGANAYLAIAKKLFRSDGTAAGTYELADLQQDSYSSSYPSAAMDLTLLYSGGAGETEGLWKTDGTAAGTGLVKAMTDISAIHADPAGYAVVSTGLSWNPSKTWLTDGTSAGTVQIAPTGASRFVSINGRTWFLARSGYYSEFRELWRTDGTPASTQMVMTGEFKHLGSAAGALYLSAFERATGQELWRTDGRAERSLVKDIAAGDRSSGPELFATAGNLLFFTADDGVNGREVWRSDGTEAGTFMLRDIRAGSASSSVFTIHAAGKYVYFVAADDVHGYELWRSDGTTAGTIRLTDSSSSSSSSFGWLAEFDGNLVFSGSDAVHGTEPWSSDGTAAGTFMLADLVSGVWSSSPWGFSPARSLVYFLTAGSKLWAMPRAATRVSVAGASVVEGDSGTTLLQFTLTRSGDTSGATNVSYATEDVTAVAGADYESAGGSVSFAAGETVKTVAVAVLADTSAEPNESFALVLTSVTGGTLIRERAFGLIGDDDARVALSIAYLPKASSWYSGNRTFRITNTGPSAATVTMRVSESPFSGTFSCDYKNPSVCSVGLVRAGESVDFSVNRESGGTTDPAIVPGRTLTASVHAAEAEDDLSDNTIARMIGAAGEVSLPPYLLAGTTATAQVAGNGYFPQTIQMSLTAGVVVSPASVVVTLENPVASFGLTVAPNGWGWTNVRIGSTTVMRIPIVLGAEEVRLDTALVSPSNYSMSFDHDEPVVLPVRIAATLHDGTRPSGTVTLRKASDGSAVQVQTLDGEGKATFTVNGLAIGSHEFRVSYSGDSHFAPLTAPLQSYVYVTGRATSTKAVIIERACGESEILVTVRNLDGHTPTGTVNVTVGGFQFNALPLTATGTPGEARATLNYAFTSTGYAFIDVDYIPNWPFTASGDYVWLYPVACPAPTLIASAVSSTSVSMIWSDVGASQYEVLRGIAPSAWVVVGTTAGTSFVDTTVSAGKSYLYRIQAKNAAGVIRSTSAPDLATTIIFTDDPIVFRTTAIKAAHITELRVAANAVRTLAGRSTATFPPIAPGALMQVSDITTLRTAIGEALTALGLPAVSWVDGVAGGSPVKTMHVQQLRNVVK